MTQDTTITDELAACPFCGGEARYGIVTEGGESNPDYGGHFIQCANEQCYGCMGLRFACGDDPKPALREAWNTRPKDTPTEQGAVAREAHDLLRAAADALDRASIERDLSQSIDHYLSHPVSTNMQVAEAVSPWSDCHSGTALSFEPGVFNLNRDGSANIAFSEAVIEWENDDESGAPYVVAKLPVGEAEAIRDWLNKWLPAPSAITASSTTEDSRSDPWFGNAAREGMVNTEAPEFHLGGAACAHVVTDEATTEGARE